MLFTTKISQLYTFFQVFLRLFYTFFRIFAEFYTFFRLFRSRFTHFSDFSGCCATAGAPWRACSADSAGLKASTAWRQQASTGAEEPVGLPSGEAQGPERVAAVTAEASPLSAEPDGVLAAAEGAPGHNSRRLLLASEEERQ